MKKLIVLVLLLADVCQANDFTVYPSSGTFPTASLAIESRIYLVIGGKRTEISWIDAMNMREYLLKWRPCANCESGCRGELLVSTNALTGPFYDDDDYIPVRKK